MKHKFNPSTIVTLDNEGLVRVWQENQLKKEISFFNIASLRIENFESLQIMPSLAWIRLEDQLLPEFRFDPKEFFPSLSKLEYGVYENEHRSIDWLLLLKVKYCLNN